LNFKKGNYVTRHVCVVVCVSALLCLATGAVGGFSRVQKCKGGSSVGGWLGVLLLLLL
jgi:hypothetical protein